MLYLLCTLHCYNWFASKLLQVCGMFQPYDTLKLWKRSDHECLYTAAYSIQLFDSKGEALIFSSVIMLNCIVMRTEVGFPLKKIEVKL